MEKALLVSISTFVIFFSVYAGIVGFLTYRQKRQHLQSRLSLDLHENKLKSTDSKSLFQKRRSSLIEKKLNTYLGKFRSENAVQLEFYRAGLSLSLTQSLFIYVGIVLCLTVLSSVFLYWSLVTKMILFMSLTALGFYFVLEFLKDRRQKLVIKHLPTALDIILRALKAGYSVEKTFVVVAREIHPSVGGEFKNIVDQMSIGVSYEDALRHAAERVHTSDFYFLANALIIQRQTGGSLSETLENILFLLHKRQEIRMKTMTLSAEAKSTGLILGSVPIGIWVIVSILKPEYLEFFFYDDLGSQLLKVVIVLLILETFIIKWLVNIKVE